MSIQLTGRFWADTADEATAAARQWIRDEPGLALRTIARVVAVPDRAAFDVTVAVADRGNHMSEDELVAAYGGLPGAPIG